MKQLSKLGGSFCLTQSRDRRPSLLERRLNRISGLSGAECELSTNTPKSSVANDDNDGSKRQGEGQTPAMTKISKLSLSLVRQNSMMNPDVRHSPFVKLVKGDYDIDESHTWFNHVPTQVNGQE